MKPGYKIENELIDHKIHWAILVMNWSTLNIVQNTPIIKNSSLLTDKNYYNIGIWKLKNLKK